MEIKTFYHPKTFTLTYVVYDPSTKDAVVIDPVLDYDQKASKTDTKSINDVVRFVKDEALELHYILETHAHADHLTGAQDLKKVFPNAKNAIGTKIRIVQETFKGIFDLGDNFKTDGSQFDVLLEDGEEVKAGTLKIKSIETPGHTPACVSFLINDEALFTGDALFMPDFGTGRCDFPAGDSKTLYQSITNKIYALPDNVKIFVGHDYQPKGRALAYETTVGESKAKNVQLNAETSEQDFVSMRDARDKSLEAPVLLLPSVQININAGKMPEAAANGLSYLKIPITARD